MSIKEEKLKEEYNLTLYPALYNTENLNYYLSMILGIIISFYLERKKGFFIQNVKVGRVFT